MGRNSSWDSDLDRVQRAHREKGLERRSTTSEGLRLIRERVLEARLWLIPSGEVKVVVATSRGSNG